MHDGKSFYRGHANTIYDNVVCMDNHFARVGHPPKTV